MYLKAVCHYSFPADRTFEECVRLAAEAGFQGFEIGLDPKGPLPPGADDDQIRRVTDLFSKERIEVAGLICGYLWDFHPLSDSKNERKEAVDSVLSAVETVSKLGLDKLTVISGNRTSGDGTEVGYEAAYERLSRFLSKLAERGKDLGVTILIENVWSKFLYSPLEMRRLVDDSALSHLGVFFDVANVLLYGEPQDWIRILGKRIGGVHFKDWRADIGTIKGFCPLLEGDVDFPEVMKALKEIGYEGMISAEIEPVAGPLFPAWLKQTSLAMDAILGLAEN